MVFLEGAGKGKRKLQATSVQRPAGYFFPWTTRVFKHPHFLCYILYIEQVPTTRRPLPRTEDREGPGTPRSVTDSTEEWVWCLMYMRSMLHVISVICLGFRV
jgi:hypothetical protein